MFEMSSFFPFLSTRLYSRDYSSLKRIQSRSWPRQSQNISKTLHAIAQYNKGFVNNKYKYIKLNGNIEWKLMYNMN